MELFEHENLKLQLRRGSAEGCPPGAEDHRASREALFYFNSEGWIHRDVKPDNFLVSDEGVVKLIDFAISSKQKSGLSAMFWLRQEGGAGHAQLHVARANPQSKSRPAGRPL